jgi:hypothetical protein
MTNAAADTVIGPEGRLGNLEAAAFGGPNPAGGGAALQEAVVHLTGSTDVIPVKSGVISIDTAGVDATTLATPLAGAPGVGDDGKCITVVDSGGHAHTITMTANKLVPSHHVLTFGGTAGSYVILQAINGLWYIVGSSGVTAS